MVLAAILVGLVLFGILASATIAFAWSVTNGQFSNPRSAAREIFDADEPIGKSTDAFPPAQS